MCLYYDEAFVNNLKLLLIFVFVFITIPTITMQQPTGFISLSECIKKGSPAVFAFTESNTLFKQFVISLDNAVVIGERTIVTAEGEEQRSFYKEMAKRIECQYRAFYVGLLDETDSSEDILAPINQDLTVDIEKFEEFYKSVCSSFFA